MVLGSRKHLFQNAKSLLFCNLLNFGVNFISGYFGPGEKIRHIWGLTGLIFNLLSAAFTRTLRNTDLMVKH